MIDFVTSVLNFIVFSVFISSFFLKKGACNDGTSCRSWRRLLRVHERLLTRVILTDRTIVNPPTSNYPEFNSLSLTCERPLSDELTA